MVGGNGRADSLESPITYFQKGDKGAGKCKTKAHNGNYVDRAPRHKHSPEMKAVVDDVREMFIGFHACQLPKPLQDNADGIVTAVEEISGNESFKKGIEVARDTIKAGRNTINTKKKISGKVLEYIVLGIICIAGTLLATGFFKTVGR